MKTTNTNNHAAHTHIRAQKVTEALSVTFLIISIAGSLLIPETSYLNDVVFFGALALAACFGVICAKLTPNTERYRCEACGHIHIPAGNMNLRAKKRFVCPACQKKTVHSFVLPGKN